MTPDDTPSPAPKPLRQIAVALAALLWAAQAPANDRPFQSVRTAVLEDDEQVWSFESWVERHGSVRAFAIEPEYTFGGGASVQFELARNLDRRGSETGHEAEVEWKQIFNDVARDGWGWGLGAKLAYERSREGGSVPSIGLRLPVSIALGDSGALLHLNAGVAKARGERTSLDLGIAVERQVFRRTLVFAELAKESEARYAQVGLRHWIKRDRLAIDFGLQQRRADGIHASGFVIGLGWYDL